MPYILIKDGLSKSGSGSKQTELKIPSWLQHFANYLKQNNKLTPRKALQSLSRLLDVASKSAVVKNNHEASEKLESFSKKIKAKLNTMSGSGRDGSFNLKRKSSFFGSEEKKSSSGEGMDDMSLKGGGKKVKKWLSTLINKTINFIEGKTRIKPSGLLKFASVAVGIIGTGASLVTTATAGPAAGVAAGASFIGASEELWKMGKRMGEDRKQRNEQKKSTPTPKEINIEKEQEGKGCGKKGAGSMDDMSLKGGANIQDDLELKGGQIKTEKRKRKNRIKGTKKEVWEGIATKTSGGLTKNDLMLSKRGKVISKKMYQRGLGLSKKRKK